MVARIVIIKMRRNIIEKINNFSLEKLSKENLFSPISSSIYNPPFIDCNFILKKSI